LSRIGVDQQLLQESEKTIAVFPLELDAGHLVSTPVVGSNDVEIFSFATESRDGFLLPALHPAVAERVIQAQGGFVHQEQLEISTFCPFFSASTSSVAGCLAVLSCLVLRSRFGRR
jgi:hypothetical protein